MTVRLRWSSCIIVLAKRTEEPESYALEAVSLCQRFHFNGTGLVVCPRLEDRRQALGAAGRPPWKILKTVLRGNKFLFFKRLPHELHYRFCLMRQCSVLLGTWMCRFLSYCTVSHGQSTMNQPCSCAMRKPKNLLSCCLDTKQMTMAEAAPVKGNNDSTTSRAKAMTPNTKEALSAVARILSLTRDSQEEANSHCSMTISSLRKWVCPGLALKHGKEERSSSDASPSEHHGHYDRKQAEEHAVSLLTRPLQHCSATCSSGIGETVAQLLQQNISASFAILVDSRLHAYSSVLARHALSLPDEFTNVQEKLAEILLVGTRVEVEEISTQFAISEAEDEEPSSLTFQVEMDLTIPADRKHSKSKKTISVAFETAGSIRGDFNEEGYLDTFKVQLDTQKLLNKMVEQASRVVSCVVETTLRKQEDAGSSTMLSRSSSFLAMPPPSRIPVHKPENKKVKLLLFQSNKDGLDLLSRAAAQLPIVSPHLSGSPSPSESVRIPNLELVEEEHEDDDVSNLSVDQCADIVDTCLFGGDFALEPPFKRSKIEG